MPSPKFGMGSVVSKLIEASIPRAALMLDASAHVSNQSGEWAGEFGCFIPFQLMH